ncbi:uncharacterized protein K452DRAFT_285845 [Aplosporella prunicola CBS 121167]|uniref:Uncharacterized protein n=1 Tax=Aplosporella prunicola CBS 121167 TaxID=1176127 RepID=A0A6A6BI50_9PEZI|nr:uncharacterized protein K452DRAFT_285845 [Aplosporella prunicola CBS 121167]KAF2143810.1 hypothetical protein K452DRAFT_285845 [Aplosporella prunicola CBS 121167]
MRTRTCSKKSSSSSSTDGEDDDDAEEEEEEEAPSYYADKTRQTRQSKLSTTQTYTTNSNIFSLPSSIPPPSPRKKKIRSFTLLVSSPSSRRKFPAFPQCPCYC